jgi:hypothetical protein
MQPHTLNNKITFGIGLEGGMDGYVPYLVMGRSGSKTALVIAVNKRIFHQQGDKTRLRQNCSVATLEDGRLEIVAGDDPNDKRLLVLVQSNLGKLIHTLDNVEVLAQTDRDEVGTRQSLVVVEAGGRIPMVNRDSHYRFEEFEFHNNDGTAEIIPLYTKPKTPTPTTPAAETKVKEPKKKRSATLLFWLGIVIGFVTAHAMHLLRPM